MTLERPEASKTGRGRLRLFVLRSRGAAQPVRRGPRIRASAVQAVVLSLAAILFIHLVVDRAVAGPAASPVGAPPNILLISIDTLRADRLGCLGSKRGLTPNLDRFAAGAVVFEQAWAQSNLTSMSHGSLFTSRYPSELGEAGPTFRMDEHSRTLAEVLQIYRYQTAAFTAGGHLQAGWGFDRGFDSWWSSPPMGSFFHTVPEALHWLAARTENRDTESRPFFVFLHSYDVHAPYLAPPPYGLAWTEPETEGPWHKAMMLPIGAELILDGYQFKDEAVMAELLDKERPRSWDAAGRARVGSLAHSPESQAIPFSATDLAAVAAVYDGGVAYADAWFGRLMLQLEERHLLDSTVIVVLGDHGEALGEDGRFGHGDSLWDTELHVPLIVKAPGVAPHSVAEPVALLDVLPTLLELAGAAPLAEAAGRSLVPALRGERLVAGRLVFSESNDRGVSVRSPTGRLSFSGVRAGSTFLPELLASAELGGPAFRLYSTAAAEEQEALRGDLVKWSASLSKVQGGKKADPRLVDEMRKQGYWAP